MSRSVVIALTLVVACGGNGDHAPDAATPDATAADAGTPDAAGPLRLFGIDTAQAGSETYAQALAVSASAGASFIPQAIDWNRLEAGPDDTFAADNVDSHKWDISAPTQFVGDNTHGYVTYTSSVANDSDRLNARYTIDGVLDATVQATLVSGGSNTEATLLLRFGSDNTAGNRCAVGTDDEFVALVLKNLSGTPTLIAGICKDGAFTAAATAPATATTTLEIKRTAATLTMGAKGATPFYSATLATAFTGAARVGLFAGNTSGPSAVQLSLLHAGGTAAWDTPSDRFVGDPDINFPAALEAQDLAQPLVINLRTINTNGLSLPSDLAGSGATIDFSRADIRQRYRDVVDYLFASTPNLPIVGFSVGNEVDIYLGSDATAWSEFATFTADVIPYVRAKLPAGVPVSVTVTAAGMSTQTANITAIEQAADVVFVTYYPLASHFVVEDPSVVPGDIAAVLAATTKPVLFAEAGYPSASPPNGTPANQAAFFTAMFDAWDAYPTQLRGFSVSWLTEALPATVTGWVTQYGYFGSPDAAAFAAYLGSIGVRAADGTAKPALATISAAAHARGL